MDKWQSWVDELLRSVIGSGDVSWLPGAGQPLALGDEEHVPPDLRMAYRIMREHNVTPEWIDLGNELLAQRATLERRLVAYVGDYQQRLEAARRANSFVLEREAEQRWQAAQARWIEEMQRYNSRVLTYNVLIPPQIAQREPLQAEKAIQQALQRAGLPR